MPENYRKRFNWDRWDTFDSKSDGSGFRADDQCPDINDPDGIIEIEQPSPARLLDEAERSKFRFNWYAPGSLEDISRQKFAPRIESVEMTHSVLINTFIREQGK